MKDGFSLSFLDLTNVWKYNFLVGKPAQVVGLGSKITGKVRRQ